MSNNTLPMPTVRINEPRTDIKSNHAYGVILGASEVTCKPFPTNSFSISSLNFNCPPPNTSIIIDRKVYLDVTFQMTFTGTRVGGGNLLDDLGLYDAPRALPLAHSIKTLNVKINDGSVTVPINDVITCFERYYYNDYKNVYTLSATPTFLDQSQNYSELTNTIRNPLAPYSGGSFYGEPRGGHPLLTVISNTPTQAVINLRLIEPLFLSPFNFGYHEHPGFIGVQSMEVNITFDGNLPAMLWSHADNGSSTYTNIAVAITQQPQLLFTYLSPSVVELMPTACVYPYYAVDRYVTDMQGALAPGASFTIYSNNIQLNSHPKRVYVYARQRNNDLTITSTDTFARINNISISYSNKAGLLSAATPSQLYQISRKNGCDMSYAEWYGAYATGQPRQTSGVGSVFCFEPSSDIGLDAISAVGMLENIQLQISVNITNINPTQSIVYSIYVVIVNEGTITIVNNRFITQIGVVTRNDVLGLAEAPSIEYQTADKIGEGGTFFGALKNIVTSAIPYANQVLPIAKMGCKALEAVTGQGVLDVDESTGGRRRRHYRKHHVMKGRGGDLISRDELSNLANDYE